MPIVTAVRTGDLSGDLDDLVDALRDGQRDVGKAVGKAARTSVLADVKSHRGTLTMSRMGPRARLGVTTRVDATATSSRVELVARPAGMWAIAEYGTRPHTIRANRGTGGLFVRGQFYDKVDHPGATGRPYWQRATDALDDALVDDITHVFDAALGF